MTVAEAKDAARAWIYEHRDTIDGYAGAYFTGSINGKSDTDTWPATSDVDFHVFVDGDVPKEFKQRKIVYRGVLMEPLYSRLENMKTPEQVAESHMWACHFVTDNIIDDPTGHLSSIQRGVSDLYYKSGYVRTRCEASVKQFDGFAKAFEKGEGDEIDALFRLLGAVICAATVPVAAALRAPTIGGSLLRMREVAERHERTDLYEFLLRIAGLSEVTKAQASDMLRRLEAAFGCAIRVIRTPFWFDFDICEEARSYCIDGAKEKIEADNRAGALFLLLIYDRCLRAIADDGTAEEKERFLNEYHKTTTDLGLDGVEQLSHRLEELRELMPKLREFAETIIAGNRDIVP